MEQLVSSYPGARAPGQIKKRKRKLQAASDKPQASSGKRHKKDIIK